MMYVLAFLAGAIVATVIPQADRWPQRTWSTVVDASKWVVGAFARVRAWQKFRR